MSIVAVCPASSLAAHNATLEAQGFGPGNFSVACTGSTVRPSHAGLHSGNVPGFLAALQALPGIFVDTYDAGKPRERLEALLAGEGLRWLNGAPELPDRGTLTRFGLYRYNRSGADEPEVWMALSAFSRDTWGGDPRDLAASIIRRVRRPGSIEPWQQPIDEFDAYQLINPFTGEGDKASHDGAIWQVSQADGSGNNVWEPGAFGWTRL